MADPEVTFARPTFEHVEQLALQLRPQDLAEVLAQGYSSGFAAVWASLERSDVAVAVLFDGEVAAIAGAVIVTPGTALAGPQVCVAWALTAAVVDRFPMTFFRVARRVVAQLRLFCPDLRNFVDARYAGALRLLQSLGFRLHGPRPHGPHGLPFFLATSGGA